jgi:TonB family protein
VGLAKLIPMMVVLMGCSSAHESKLQNESAGGGPHYGLPDVWIAPITKEPEALDGGVVDVPPKLVESTLPEYPALALEAGIEGMVVLEFVVGPEGEVVESRIVTRRATVSMEQAVQKVVPTFRFRPALRSGSPIACRVEVPIYFSIR